MLQRTNARTQVQGLSSLLGIKNGSAQGRYADTERHAARCLAEYARMDEGQRAERRKLYEGQLTEWYTAHGRVEKLDEVPSILEAWAGESVSQ